MKKRKLLESSYDTQVKMLTMSRNFNRNLNLSEPSLGRSIATHAAVFTFLNYIKNGIKNKIKGKKFNDDLKKTIVSGAISGSMIGTTKWGATKISKQIDKMTANQIKNIEK